MISLLKNKFQRVLIYGFPSKVTVLFSPERRGTEGADESLSERDLRSSMSKCEGLEIKLILQFVCTFSYSLE